MTLAALLLAPAATVVLLATAALSSDRKGAPALVRALGNKHQIEGNGATTLFGLSIFGVVIGIPIALGLADLSVLSLLAAPLCCMVSSWLGLGDLRQGLSSVAWFTLLAWCASVPYLVVGSLSATAPSAMQTVLGPLPFHQGPFKAASLVLAMGAGSVAAARWTASLPIRTGAVGSLVRWGECALAGTLVFGATLGPGLGGIAYGPFDPTVFGWTAISMGSTIAGVICVVILSKRQSRIPERYSFPLLALLAATAMTGAVLG